MQTLFQKLNDGQTMYKSLCFVGGALFISYLVLVGVITKNVIARQSVERETEDIATRVSELEVRYIGMQKSFDLARAETLGLHESADVHYASRSSAETAVVTRHGF